MVRMFLGLATAALGVPLAVSKRHLPASHDDGR